MEEHILIRWTTFLLTYLQLYLLEIQHAQLWQLVDDIEPVMLLVGHRIPQQAGKSLSTSYGVEIKTLFKDKTECSNLRRLSVFTVASGSKSPWKGEFNQLKTSSRVDMSNDTRENLLMLLGPTGHH